MSIQTVVVTLTNSQGTGSVEKPMHIGDPEMVQRAADNLASINSGYVVIADKAGNVLATAGDKPQ